ncbi:hypothetical protein CEXT_413461 [Caerostris extrusa]|uniref:Uncharacterized protein n=1 Tax=Caerostris extrusa TaxID=172846 RepID=A0AAV4MZB9_CAEEX|nr:hypothetical protein CEXT_413461 [Caerostris extrusa]
MNSLFKNHSPPPCFSGLSLDRFAIALLQGEQKEHSNPCQIGRSLSPSPLDSTSYRVTGAHYQTIFCLLVRSQTSGKY